MVTTIGDAVMATWRRRCGCGTRSVLAVMLNDRQDYFGQAENIASWVQQLAKSRSIFATKQVVNHSAASKVLEASGTTPRRTIYDSP